MWEGRWLVLRFRIRLVFIRLLCNEVVPAAPTACKLTYTTITIPHTHMLRGEEGEDNDRFLVTAYPDAHAQRHACHTRLSSSYSRSGTSCKQKRDKGSTLSKGMIVNKQMYK